MIVPRGIIAPLALLVALSTTTVVFTSGIAAAPSAFFSGADVVLGPPGEQLAGRAPVDASVVPALRALPSVRVASPEIYLPLSVGRSSAFARGVEFDSFLAIEGASIVDGALPDAPDEVALGEGAATRLDLRVGDRVLLASPFARYGANVAVAAIVGTTSVARDELLLPLDLARQLAYLAPGSVHVVRVSAEDPLRVFDTIHSVAPNFTFSDVTISTDDIVPGESVTLRANLTNWGRTSGTKLATVFADGEPVATKSFAVPSRATIPIAISFELPQNDRGAVNITINPTFRVNVREPTLFFDALPVVEEGDPIPVSLRTPEGPAQNVNVSTGSVSAFTDASGTAIIPPLSAGQHRLIARTASDIEGSATLFVAARGYRDLPLVKLASLQPPSEVVGEGRASKALAIFENDGGVDGSFSGDVLVDGHSSAPLSIHLGPGDRLRVPIDVPPLAPGEHNITIDGTTQRTRFVVFAGDPRIETLLRAYDAAGRADPGEATTYSGEDYVTSLVGNISAAVGLIAIAGSILTALCAIAVLQRHLATRAQSIGAIRALGATNEQVLNIVTRESVQRALIAAPLGIAAGLLMALAVQEAQLLRAFGHSVRIVIGWPALGTLAILSVAFVAICSRALVSGMLRSPIDSLIRDAPLQGPPSEPDAEAARD